MPLKALLEVSDGWAIAGVANQSETKNHISYSVTAKRYIIHTGTHDQNHIPSSHTYARFIVNITNQHDNDRNSKAIIVMHVI